MTQTILIVEDELSISTLIQYNLEKFGFKTDVAYDGEEAWHKIMNQNYDLIILDIMLPKVDGIELCKMTRSKGLTNPILMVSAKGEEDDIVNGLNYGADDYIKKPFSPKELIARIEAVLRRSKQMKQDEDSSIEIGDLEAFTQTFEVYFKKSLLRLTKKEYELLIYLMKNVNITLSRDQLLHAVWDYDFIGDTRIVDVHVSRLREKIEDDSRRPKYIQTVHGFGYKMENPV